MAIEQASRGDKPLVLLLIDIDHVKRIIDMGHALDMQIVAEGVENAEQATRLREYGCDFLQGYLFSEPLAQADFADWLASQPG
jgi:EAL domain-containing protein (putative c-di-GMP-specific phosphodiesterase class I)